MSCLIYYIKKSGTLEKSGTCDCVDIEIHSKLNSECEIFYR